MHTTIGSGDYYCTSCMRFPCVCLTSPIFIPFVPYGPPIPTWLPNVDPPVEPPLTNDEIRQLRRLLERSR